MIRLRFKTSVVGPNYAHHDGEEVDWRDVAEAVKFIGSGAAEAVRQGEEPARSAELPKPKERATVPGGKRGK